MARASASSPRYCASRQAARRKGDQGLSAPPAARHSRQLAQEGRAEGRQAAGSRSFTTGARVGAASSASSPASRSARKVRTRASSSPICNNATPVGSTRMSTAGAVRPRTTSNPGRPTWRPTTASRAPRQAPTNCGCSCTAERLLDHVGPSRFDAEALDVARGAVRHVAPAPDRIAGSSQARTDPRAPADIVSGAAYFTLRARANPAPRNPALRQVMDGA